VILVKPELKTWKCQCWGSERDGRQPNDLEVSLLQLFIILAQVLHYLELSLNASLPGIL